MAEINAAGKAMLAAGQKHMSTAPMLFVDVPEWPDGEGKPARIWYRSTMTMDESFDIAQWKAGEGGGRYQQVYILIRRALDENGSKLFDLTDEDALLALDSEVVLRLASRLITRPKVDDAKKGSAPIPTA